MPHYDGPAFNREPHPAAPVHQDYTLPPRTPRKASEPQPAHRQPTTSEPTRHSVDPLAALIAVPRTTHRAARTQIDYQAIAAQLRPSDDQVFRLATAADEQPWATAAAGGAVRSDAADTAAPDSDAAVTPASADPSVGVAMTPPMPDADAAPAPSQPARVDQATTVSQDDPAANAAALDVAPMAARSEATQQAPVAPPLADTDSDASTVTEMGDATIGDDATDGAAVPPADEAGAEASGIERVQAETAMLEPEPESAPDAVAPADEPEPAADAVAPADEPVAATVSELIAANAPLPVEPELARDDQPEAKHPQADAERVPGGRPSKLPNPYAVRASVRAYLKAQKQAKHAAPASEVPVPGETPAGERVSDDTGDAPVPASESTTAAPGSRPTTPVADGDVEPADAVELAPVAPAGVPEAASVPAAMRESAQPSSASGADIDAAPEAEPVPLAAYQLPPLSLLKDPVVPDDDAQAEWVARQSDKLDATLSAFNVGAHTVAHTIGPTVTQFQIALDPGVRVSKITNLTDDLKRALAAKDIRIEAPIPGQSTVGIEIPNLHPRPVMLKEVLNSPAFQTARSPLTVALGVDLFGQPVVTNIDKMPHGLIAGATGSGKSVFINSLITSLLYKATPADVRLLLIDPKAVELAVYNDLPHLVSPVVSEPKAASAALKWAVNEMEERYQRLAAGGVRSLDQFNDKARAHGDFGLVMPHIVIIIDELADLMMVAASEVQDYIARITAKARAAGIHLIVATQRPSVDVITGTIKNNIPTRVAFMVASQVDSRTIIDHNGAERLLGKGDMLYLGNGASQPQRLQGTFVDREIDAIVDFVRLERAPQYLFQPDKLVAKADAIEAQDDLFPEVLKYIAGEKTVSTSKLQRVFSIGYNRAANLIDDLEMRHYISPANGSKPRDVYFNKEDLPAPKDSRDPRAY